MSSASTARRLVPKALLLALAALALAGVLLALFSGPAEAATTFTVNRTGDENDLDFPSGTFDGSSNGKCDTSSNRGNQCTLRAAIQEANETSGADVIRFNIGSTASVKTISPASPLPEITDPLTINGYSQQGASPNTRATGNNAVLKIQLNGTNAGANANGLVIQTADSTIKGLVINRFDGDGVDIPDGASRNEVQGNFIGTNAAGTAPLGNGSDGVSLDSTSNNTIGGTSRGARNVISGNQSDGVVISGFSGAGNDVLGNYIGTDKNGTAALGNGSNGVDISGAGNNTVGGAAAGARNVISGNDQDGVGIFGSFASGNEVQSNFIGTNAAGTAPLGNGSDGVDIFGAPDNTIGGTTREAGNRIAHSATGAGVEVTGSTSVGNSILSNLIFSNGGLGIDLEGGTEDANGVTANDTKDPDTGANNLQNFPVITSVTQSSSFFNPTRVSGTLNTTPSQDFTVQCFLASEIPEEADDSGHGEGQAFMAEDTDVRTDANGDGSFECNFLFPVSLEGKRWSATATNEATGDTSEFSANFPDE